MEESGEFRGGLLASVRRLGQTALGAFQNRLELFAVELQEEKNWVITALLWTAASIFFGLMGVITITATVVLFCPEPARPYVMGGFCIVYCALAIWAGLGLRKQLKNREVPFSNSLSEFKKDIEWLKGPDK